MAKATRNTSISSTTTQLCMSIESLSLEGISDDHEAVGMELKESVKKWLDFEWMEQTIHGEIGEICRSTYTESRGQGDAEVMSIMMKVADNLTTKWDLFYDDAFVGPYDVANYVSDFLTAKTGVEGCECSSRIH